MKAAYRFVVLAVVFVVNAASAAEPLPNTKLLTEEGDLAAKMVAGMHKYLDRELAASPKARSELWKADLATPEALAKSLPAKRERLRKLLGIVDERMPAKLEYVTESSTPLELGNYAAFTVYAVRWDVLPGVQAEGLLLEPKEKATANVVAIPDATWTPEQIAGLARGPEPYAKRLAESGCRVLVPMLIDRADTLSGNARLPRKTNQPHREFIHRMAFEMGRTLAGYEVQKVLAAVDWFQSQDKKLPIGLIGVGEGGRVAFYAAACDERIKVAQVACAFGPREGAHEEPLDRNLWSQSREFGDAEVAMLIHPRQLLISPEAAAGDGPKRAKDIWPVWGGPVGQGGAAPGVIKPIPPKDAAAEWVRLGKLRAGELVRLPQLAIERDDYDWEELYQKLVPDAVASASQNFSEPHVKLDSAARHKRQFDQLVAHVQKLWRDSDATRKAYWSKADFSSPEAWEKSCDSYRDYFHTEVIGKLPEPTMPLNPRTRQVYDEPKFTGYEVMVDVYPDVFAQGILLLPKDLKPGEKRPVVVCQHGLEGVPRHTIDEEPKRTVYNHFARRLVELGYIVYAPQNPYYGKNEFRQLQRKANPLKLSLFSFIIRQHQRTIDWLETLPNVDAKKIAFYGLSYGGKTAMRVPAIEKRYCLSICSGDFNEWIGKNVSVDLDRSYMWTGEYEMYEFDLGNTFNYAEMAYLIAPRPFMVERGHDDGVGTDEMVAYEFAKVRYLYQNRLKLGDRTTIEFFPGGHQINAKGTFDFLKQHLK